MQSQHLLFCLLFLRGGRDGGGTRGRSEAEQEEEVMAAVVRSTVLS